MKTTTTTNTTRTTPANSDRQENTTTPFDLPALLRAVESDPTGEALMAWGEMVARSTLRKVADPRRNAPGETVSNSGQNPAILSLQRDLSHDMAILRNTAAAANAATRWRYDKKGQVVTETADENAAAALDSLIGETLGDGADLAQDAILELLEQMNAPQVDTTAPGWVERPYTARRLSRRVYIRLDDSAAYTDTETTPVQESFRAVRRSIDGSRAVRTNPRNGHVYLDALTPDGQDAILYRLKRWSCLGDPTAIHGDTAGACGSLSDALEWDTLTAALDLTARQMTVLKLREQGHGHKSIAKYLGVSTAAVKETVKQIRRKAAAALAPVGLDLYTDTAPAAPDTTDTDTDTGAAFLRSLRARARERAHARAESETATRGAFVDSLRARVQERNAAAWEWSDLYLRSGWWLADLYRRPSYSWEWSDLYLHPGR